MKRNLLVITGALVVSAASAQAQGGASDPQCNSGIAAQRNACNTAVDLFKYMAPQLGSVVAGGNTTLGQGGALGGPGHFAITLRGNVLAGSLPQVDKYDPTSTTRTLDTKNQALPLPTVDAAIGIFSGLSFGVTRVGGLDLLLNGSFLPEYSGNGVTVRLPNGKLNIGYGARVGLLQEGLLTPGIGVSYMKRDLPTIGLTAVNGPTRFDVKNLSVKTSSWRVTASKSLIAFGLAAGVGQDTYDSHASVNATTTLVPISASFNGNQSITRTNYFGDLSLNIVVVKFVAEVGMVQGGKITTYNTFNGKAADASRLYGSAGIRVGF